MQYLGSNMYGNGGGGGAECNFNSFLQQVLMSSSSSSSSVHQVLNIHNNNNSTLCSSLMATAAEAKTIAANKSHSEAERRRRKRINGHLATLRSLLPNTIKSDKASLLAEVVRSIRELKKTTSELAENGGDDDDDNDFINMFPSESDELKLCYIRNDVVGGDSSGSSNSSNTIKATICCEDRPEIIIELTRALNSIQTKVVKAEMATVGGRIKAVLWLKMAAAEKVSGEEEGLTKLRRAIKVVIDKSILLAAPVPIPHAHGHALLGNKRARLYHI